MILIPHGNVKRVAWMGKRWHGLRNGGNYLLVGSVGFANYTIPLQKGGHKGFKTWIPASAGMTREAAAMTQWLGRSI
jgi:hypothetical protein